MKDLSKSDEQKALTALETAIEHVGEGMAPNDALTKVAEESKLTSQMTQRMIEAYNVSKTLSHLKNADGEKRADSFQVADPNVILDNLFPAEPKTEHAKAASALHPDYILGGVDGDFMKTASVELPPLTDKPALPYERDPGAAARRAFDGRNRLITLHKQAQANAQRHYWKMLAHVDEAADYWKQVTPTEDFALVEKRAAATYGAKGSSLMNLIYHQGALGDARLSVKRAIAAELGGHQTMFPEDQKPYSIIADAVKEAQEVARHSKVAGRRQREIHAHAISNMDYLPEGLVVAAINYFDPPEIDPGMPTEKSARDMPAFDKQDRPAKAKKMYNAMMHRPAEKKKMIERYGSKDKAEEVAAATASKYGK